MTNTHKVMPIGQPMCSVSIKTTYLASRAGNVPCDPGGTTLYICDGLGGVARAGDAPRAPIGQGGIPDPGADAQAEGRGRSHGVRRLYSGFGAFVQYIFDIRNIILYFGGVLPVTVPASCRHPTRS